METFLIKAAQLILAFAFLVIIHEFGHFLFARMFGVRVEKFYIFFNPWFSLFRYKSRCLKRLEAEEKKREEAEAKGIPYQPEETEDNGKKKKSHFWKETEFGIGWLPLGGYCKIAGMIDESMDKEQMKRPPQPWEFRSKPAWQRLLIMVAGVLFNFLLAILIYAGIVYATGEKYVPLSEARQGMLFTPEAQKIGFRNGDVPIAADGVSLNEPAEAVSAMLEARNVEVLRNGDTVNIAIPQKFIFAIDREARTDSLPFQFMTYSIPARFTQVMSGYGAEKAGVKANDQVVAIDGKPVTDLYQFMKTVKGHANKTMSLTVARKVNNRIDTLTLQVPLDASSRMGVQLEVDPTQFYNSREIHYNLISSVPRGVGLDIDPADFYKAEEKHYNIFQSIPRGITMGVDKLTSYAESMKLVFTKEGAQSIGGFGTIGSIFPDHWNWIAFWNIAAFLSVALAFMNILPIPALDGGHVLFLLYEVIFRRKPRSSWNMPNTQA